MDDLLGGVDSRKRAIVTGELIDVSGLAKTAGIPLPIAISKEVMADCIQWSAVDTARTKTVESSAKRFWNLFVALRYAIHDNKRNDAEFEFNLIRTSRNDLAGESLARLRVVIEKGEDGRPALTLRLSWEHK